MHIVMEFSRFWLLSLNFLKILHTTFSVFAYYSNHEKWDRAKTLCEDRSLRLVKVDTEEKYAEVKAFLMAEQTSQDIYIGLRHSSIDYYDVINTTHKYEHIDGTISDYLPWYDGEPNEQDSEQCIRMTTSTYEFRTTDCSKKYAYLCEDVPTTTSTQTSVVTTTTEATTTYAETTIDRTTTEVDLTTETAEMSTTTADNITAENITRSIEATTARDITTNMVTLGRSVSGIGDAVNTTITPPSSSKNSTGSTGNYSAMTGSATRPDVRSSSVTAMVSTEVAMETNTTASHYNTTEFTTGLGSGVTGTPMTYSLQTISKSTQQFVTIATNLVSSVSSICPIETCLPRGCSCQSFNWSDPVFLALLDQQLTKIKKTLQVNKKNLTVYVSSKKSSTSDKRASSTVTGAIGVSLLVGLASLIVIPDVVNVLRFIQSKRGRQ